jgi:hypothetical protein
LAFQSRWSLIGWPSISLRSGISSDGLPFAVRLVARRLDEATLLRAARHVEEVLGLTNASRNRLVIEACERLVHSNRGVWPPGFLEGAHLSTKDRKDLAAAGQALERSIRRARRSRRGEPFSHVGA